MIPRSDERWAIWRHPIIRRETDPVPMIAAGSYPAMEGLFFEMVDRPDEDPFYLYFGPYADGPQ